MIGEYICPFYHNSGKICGKPCMRPEGCNTHWKSKRRVPCTDCGKPTGSTSGRCPLHIRGYYVIQYYRRLRANSGCCRNHCLIDDGFNHCIHCSSNMIGKYTCPFYLNSGEICGKSCMRTEGCHEHRKAKRHVPCIDCGKPTGSISGFCPLHARGVLRGLCKQK